jgi:hypothetical protein
MGRGLWVLALKIIGESMKVLSYTIKVIVICYLVFSVSGLFISTDLNAANPIEWHKVVKLTFCVLVGFVVIGASLDGKIK